jgi:hypothetical protein
MRVVIGAFSLAHPGGTESYVTTVAHELRRLGHEPVVTAQELGPVAEHAQRRGILVAGDPSELPKTCDAVFAQDAIMAGALGERYPESRLVVFAHSSLYDHQLPVLIPGVVSAVVVASDRVGARIDALPLDAPIVRLRHPIDTETFVAGGRSASGRARRSPQQLPEGRPAPGADGGVGVGRRGVRAGGRADALGAGRGVRDPRRRHRRGKGPRGPRGDELCPWSSGPLDCRQVASGEDWAIYETRVSSGPPPLASSLDSADGRFDFTALPAPDQIVRIYGTKHLLP